MSDSESQARAQMAHLAEMVAALNVDYGRLEELRDLNKQPRYIAGWNMPGYMPDNTPDEFDDADDARGYLASRIEDDAEGIEEGAPERAAALRTDAAALRAMTSEGPAAEFGATLGDTHYWITYTLGLERFSPEGEELADLEEAAGECTDIDDACQRIDESPLSVEVRSDWHAPGESGEPAEYRIVLCTGGPHVELVGTLDNHLQPDRVRCIHKDWGTSGELFDFDHDAALTYTQQFYFGE